MKRLPHETAREHIVETANRLSAEHEPEDSAGLSVMIRLYAAELDGLRSRLAPPPVQAGDIPTYREEPPPSPRTGAPDRSAGLDYFPGWPEFTEAYGDMLKSGRMRLVRDAERPRRPYDEEVYLVYLGQQFAGRFTIRRYADRVERNVLFMLDGQLVSYGRSDSPVDDLIRQFRQQATRLWDRSRR